MRLSGLSICLFCGSRSGSRPEYARAAAAFGKGLAEGGARLVYGAGDVGLMGIAAGAATAAGAEVVGFIPRHLLAKEIGKRDIHALIVTETMHERKKLMFANSDAVVALPGGAGTMDELFEVLTWRQLGLHARPVVLLDVAGFWQPFVALMRHMRAEGFLPAEMLDYFTVAPGTEAALAALEPLTARHAEAE